MRTNRLPAIKITKINGKNIESHVIRCNHGKFFFTFTENVVTNYMLLTILYYNLDV